MSVQWWIETRSAEVDYTLLGLMEAPLQWWAPYGMRTDQSTPWFVIEVDTNRSWRVYFGMAASKRPDLKGRLIRNSFAAQGSSRDDLYSLLHQYLSPNLSFKEKLYQICSEKQVQKWMEAYQEEHSAMTAEEAGTLRLTLFPSFEVPEDLPEVIGTGIYTVGATNKDEEIETGPLASDMQSLMGAYAILHAAFSKNKPARIGFVSYAQDAQNAAIKTAPERRKKNGYELWLIRGNSSFHKIKEERKEEPPSNPQKARTSDQKVRAKTTLILLLFLVVIMGILYLLI